jgi:hypothetical protein
MRRTLNIQTSLLARCLKETATNRRGAIISFFNKMAMNLCIVKSLSGEMVKNIVWKKIRAGTYTIRG